MWRMDDCFFMVVSFVIGCVDRTCQSFLSECACFPFFSFQSYFLTRSLRIFDLSFPVGHKFFSQMISGTVSWLLGLDVIFK